MSLTFLQVELMQTCSCCKQTMNSTRTRSTTLGLNGEKEEGQQSPKNEEYSCVIKDKKFVSTELDITIDGLMSPMKATRRDLLRPFTEIFKDGSDDKDDDP